MENLLPASSGQEVNCNSSATCVEQPSYSLISPSLHMKCYNNIMCRFLFEKISVCNCWGAIKHKTVAILQLNNENELLVCGPYHNNTDIEFNVFGSHTPFPFELHNVKGRCGQVKISKRKEEEKRFVWLLVCNCIMMAGSGAWPSTTYFCFHGGC